MREIEREEQTLKGNWYRGIALDIHTISSTKLDEYHFNNKRSEIGQLVYDIKYDNTLSLEDKDKKASELARIVANCIKKPDTFDVMVPVPFSKNRDFQPVYEILIKVANLLKKPIDLQYIKKIGQTPELKSIDSIKEIQNTLKGKFDVSLKYANKNIFLFDDVYSSGSTLKEVTKTLYNKGKVHKVFVMTLTKTRTKNNF